MSNQLTCFGSIRIGSLALFFASASLAISGCGPDATVVDDRADRGAEGSSNDGQVPDPDTDGDAVADAEDGCPLDPDKIAPGACGCGNPDTPTCGRADSDGDGVADEEDGCPDDYYKTFPGLCGCGVRESSTCGEPDTDRDGVPDDEDGCPNDREKVYPGNCGCGVIESVDCNPGGGDRDGDGVPDDEDECPDDPNKSAPGACGCGFPEDGSCGFGLPAQVLMSEGSNRLLDYCDSVAIRGDTALLGSTGPDEDGRWGYAVVFRRVDGVWMEEARLFGDRHYDSNCFGYSVALGDDIAVVGDYCGIGVFPDYGSVHVFERTAGEWRYRDKLSSGIVGFGYSVAVSDRTILVGSLNEGSDQSSRGTAYVYTNSGGLWREAAKLEPDEDRPGGWADQLFGAGVAIEGETIMVGAPWEEFAGPYSGCVYVFQKNNMEWRKTEKLLPTGPQYGDHLGYSIALDGDVALIGAAEREPFDNPVYGEGAAYVFTRTGGAWQQDARISAWLSSEHELGVSVALAGRRALVGAAGPRTTCERAALFERGASGWVLSATFGGKVGEEHICLAGSAVGLSGNTMLIGGSLVGGTGEANGAAFTYELDER